MAGSIVPFRNRPLDTIFVFTFALMFVIAWTIDIINAIADHGGHIPVYGNDGSIQGYELKYGLKESYARIDEYAWPPEVCWRAALWWCQYDPVLLVNPMWMKALAFLSPFIYSPLYIYFIHGFLKGNNGIRIPALMFGICMFVTLAVIFVEALIGLMPTSDPVIFTAAYGPYLFFPLLLIWRVADPEPFSQLKNSKKD